MPKAMIVSVGGTPQPIIKSILEYKPEFISFFASQDTCDKIAEIKTELTKIGQQPKSEITLAEDVNDLLHCHGKAEEAVERVTSKGYLKDNVIVDYTGGTKNMSVALALAAITHGFSFSYVGGKERTKEGVGIVVNGHEKIYQSVNPWDFLAVEEKKKIAILFNQYQFKAAKNLTDSILERSTKHKTVFKKLGVLIDGYHKWDLFSHQEAKECFKKAKLEESAEIEDMVIQSFAKASAKCMSFLEELVINDKKPRYSLILDMYANAERRFKEGKIDDAILRLYRLIEMMAQERLMTKYNINTSDVIKDSIPDILKADFIANYKNHRTGKIEIPQTASFKLLNELNDNLGKIFKTNESRFLKIQSSRNYSYLAHGLECANERTYLSFREFILALKVINTDDAPVFPEMAL